MKASQLALAALRASAGRDAPSPTQSLERSLPSLAGATGWLNTLPLDDDELRGHVVVIDFWTYTCINWLRTLPYIRAWADKYGDHGLIVVGVHTPEFSFEGNADNVRRAILDRDITYPVAIDSEYAIWEAFGNSYWPALYFSDARGHLRHHHFGEGEYAQSEMVIQQLLTEAGASGFDRHLVTVDGQGPEAAADWADLYSPENYLGQLRTENFASTQPPVLDRPHEYVAPDRLALNEWATTGNWTMGREAAVVNEANGHLSYQFHARDLHLVMGPAGSSDHTRFRVLIDGQPPGPAHGSDVDGAGFGTLTEQRLYQLIRQSEPIADRRFDIEFLSPGAAAYAFTFG
jgi:thiol-disulfide isomerase/thioredoxin